MEQDVPENGETAAEEPAIDVKPATFEAPSILEDSEAAPDPYGSQEAFVEGSPPVEPALTESPVEVVDPYTAAPPASPFPEPAAPWAEAGPFASWAEQPPADDPFIPIPYSPSSTVENIRRSGLAYSAGIAFFGSVAFSLFMGWIVDLLLGISPWGIILGIVLGSIVGFLQFFRITSRIFPKKEDGPEVRPLMSAKDDEQHDRL